MKGWNKQKPRADLTPFLRKFLLQSRKVAELESYCEGFLAAGGSPDDAECIKRYSETEIMLIKILHTVGELEAVRVAVSEWCGKNDVSKEVFSTKQAFLSLARKNDSEGGDITPVDDTMLEIMRSLFDEVKLAW